MLSNLFLIARHGTTMLNESERYRGHSNGPDADLNGDGLQAAIDGALFLYRTNLKIKKVITRNNSA